MQSHNAFYVLVTLLLQLQGAIPLAAYVRSGLKVRTSSSARSASRWCPLLQAIFLPILRVNATYATTKPNINWCVTTDADLERHESFVPLGDPNEIGFRPDIDDLAWAVRNFSQRSWQWSALHAGRLTTSRAAAACGLLEPNAARLLKIPKSLFGHGKAMRAANHLAEGGRLPIERFPDLVDRSPGLVDTEFGAGDASPPPQPPSPTYFPHISAVRMAWGSAQENTAVMVAVDHFAKGGGRVEEVGLCLPRYERGNDDLLFGASPDGVVVDGDGQQWALEVKCHW